MKGSQSTNQSIELLYSSQEAAAAARFQVLSLFFSVSHIARLGRAGNTAEEAAVYQIGAESSRESRKNGNLGKMLLVQSAAFASRAFWHFQGSVEVRGGVLH